MKRERNPKRSTLKSLTLKDVPEDLIWRAKEKAAVQRVTLKAFIIAALELAIREG